MKGSRFRKAASLLLAGTLAAVLSVPGGALAAPVNVTGSQTEDSATGTWSGASDGETGDGHIDLSYDTSGGTWKDGKADGNPEHANGSYLVTIPTKIAYEKMAVGPVSTSDDYAVNVRGALPSGGKVQLTASPEDFSVNGGKAGGISATVTQGKVAGGDTAAWTVGDAAQMDSSGNVVGTDATDNVKMTGTVKTSGEYRGAVAYGASLEEAAAPAKDAPAFATATDEEMEQAFANGAEPDVSAWHVGDKRTVTLTDGKQYTMVLMDANPYEKASDETRTPHFIWSFEELLGDTHRMNATDTNSGGWDATEMRTWLNSDVYDKLPAWLKEGTKHVKVVSDKGTDTTGTTTSEDRVFLPSSFEVFGSQAYGMNTVKDYVHLWTWYQTASNRMKTRNGSADSWWERSSSSYDSSAFCRVVSGGSHDFFYASSYYGVAPAGCI